MAKKLIYPIGEQDFKSLRDMDCVYVDKTRFIETILTSGNKYYFLARPRRFGKSLFLSTLRYFFEGRRELFKGLYIDSTGWDWTPYPVLRLDLNTDKYAEPGILDGVLDNIFKEWEAQYGVEELAENLSSRFRNIIKAAHEKTGKQVVILVDEYDKPLVGNLNKNDNFEHYRGKLAGIYSNFKSSAEHIKLVFLTGVSRFSRLSVFSDLNNLKDITFINEFADICGITEKELLDNLSGGIDELAKEFEVDFDGALMMLKQNYDGYRFAKKGSDIYNPWSLLNCLADRDILNYWSLTGTPTLIAESLKNVDADLEQVLSSRCTFRALAGLDLRNANPLALLYQTGYLTIKDYERPTDIVTLGVPNSEVRQSLFEELLPLYVKIKNDGAGTVVFKIIDSLRYGKPEELMKNLDAYFAGIPYDLRIENENNFQNALYILLTMIGVNTNAEVHTSDGRIDLLITTPRYVYLIELKYDGTPGQALQQIEEKQYARKFTTDPRKLFKIGISFSSKTRRIEGWEILTE